MGADESGGGAPPPDDSSTPESPREIAWTDPDARHAAVRAAIDGLPLHDAVLVILLTDERHPVPEGTPRLALADYLPDVDAPRLVAAMRAGFALLRAAGEYGIRYAHDHEPGPQLVARMAAEHPGFSPKSYGDVLFHGVSLVR